MFGWLFGRGRWRKDVAASEVTEPRGSRRRRRRLEARERSYQLRSSARLGQSISLGGESLESRAMLAAFSYDGSTLTIDLNNASEAITLTSSGGGNYVFTSTSNFTGTNTTGLTGNAPPTLTVTSALALDTVAITDSQSGTSVSFGSTVNGITLTVTGTFTAPAGTYRVQYFSSLSDDANAQGRTLLGYRDIAVSGATAIDQVFAQGDVIVNDQITATATLFTGGLTPSSTSAFSASVKVV